MHPSMEMQSGISRTSTCGGESSSDAALLEPMAMAMGMAMERSCWEVAMDELQPLQFEGGQMSGEVGGTSTPSLLSHLSLEPVLLQAVEDYVDGAMSASGAER